MKLSARIAELEAMMSSGQISQQEFDVLVSLAQTQNAKSMEQSQVLIEENNSENPQSETGGSSSIFSIKKVLTIFVVIVFLVVAFKFTRDPKESTEFKNLLQKRTELLAKKTDLESKTADVIKLQSYVNDYTERIDAWKRRINDVNSLGISE
jgi:hypothetical protein